MPAPFIFCKMLFFVQKPFENEGEFLRNLQWDGGLHVMKQRV